MLSSLVLEASNSSTDQRQNHTQRNQDKSKHGTSTQSNEGDLGTTRKKECIQTSRRGRASEKCRGTNIQSTGNQGQDERCTLNGEGCNAIDQ
jgi:hypothetical protein